MINYDLKTCRALIRLSVFCVVFAALAAGFGIAYVYERDGRQILERTAVTRAHGELYGYMSGIGGTLVEMRESSPSETVLLTSKLNMLTGGAKSTLASIPFGDRARERLQSYLSECASYSLNLSGRLMGGDMPTDSDTAAIELYIGYSKMVCERLYGCVSPDGAVSIELLNAISLDTPPDFAKVEFSVNRPSKLNIVPEPMAKASARRYLGTVRSIRRIDCEPDILRYSNGGAFVDIMRHSGELIRLSSGGVQGDGIFSYAVQDALCAAERFLAGAGLGTAKLESYSESDGRLNITYVYRGYAIYTGVSLENGRVTYFDASGYYLGVQGYEEYAWGGL